jgi:hypothetical protein
MESVFVQKINIKAPYPFTPARRRGFFMRDGILGRLELAERDVCFSSIAKPRTKRVGRLKRNYEA